MYPNDTVLLIIGQLASIIEIIIVVNFIIKCLGWRGNVRLRSLYFIGLCLILLCIAQINGRFGNSHGLVIVLDIVILLAFSRRFLRGNIHTQLLGCLISFLVIVINNILIMQVLALLTKIPVYQYLYFHGLMFLVGVILSKLLLWLVLDRIQTFFNKRVLNLSKRYYFIVNILIVFTVVIVLLLFYVINLSVYSLVANAILVAVSLCIAVLSCYIGYCVFMISDQNTQIMKYELIQLKNQERENQIEEIRRVDSRIKQLSHDFKNHCMSMQELIGRGCYAELDDYLSSLTGRYLAQKVDSIHISNDIINAVLNFKIRYCQENSIDISTFIIGNVSDVKSLEVSVLLFNLLDNAIAACLKKTGIRKIEVCLSRQKGTFEVFIKNTLVASVLDKNKELTTEKADKECHGIGHISVETIVEEAGGIIEYYEEDKMFCVHIFIPNY